MKNDDGTQRVYRAHRFAMTVLLKREIGPEEYVLHRCDNPLCVKAIGMIGRIFGLVLMR